MDKTIVKAKVEDIKCSLGDADRYLGVLNGIVSDCMHGGFSHGYRNQVILDMTVSAHMLGLDPEHVLDLLVEHKVINPAHDDTDTWMRVTRAMYYKDRFDWDYMLDPDEYECQSSDMPDAPVVFVIG